MTAAVTATPTHKHDQRQVSWWTNEPAEHVQAPREISSGRRREGTRPPLRPQGRYRVATATALRPTLDPGDHYGPATAELRGQTPTAPTQTRRATNRRQTTDHRRVSEEFDLEAFGHYQMKSLAKKSYTGSRSGPAEAGPRARALTYGPARTPTKTGHHPHRQKSTIINLLDPLTSAVTATDAHRQARRRTASQHDRALGWRAGGRQTVYSLPSNGISQFRVAVVLDKFQAVQDHPAAIYVRTTGKTRARRSAVEEIYIGNRVDRAAEQRWLLTRIHDHQIIVPTPRCSTAALKEVRIYVLRKLQRPVIKQPPVDVAASPRQRVQVGLELGGKAQFKYLMRVPGPPVRHMCSFNVYHNSSPIIYVCGRCCMISQ